MAEKKGDNVRCGSLQAVLRNGTVALLPSHTRVGEITLPIIGAFVWMLGRQGCPARPSGQMHGSILLAFARPFAGFLE